MTKPKRVYGVKPVTQHNSGGLTQEPGQWNPRPAKCLWDEAIFKLREEDQQMFNCGNDSQIEILRKILAHVDSCRDQCLHKRWKIKGSGGREIFIRDVCAKLASHLQSYLHVIDIAVQYDPVHAALPWAGIRFLFQIALNSTDTFEAMIEGLEKASDVITRCTIMEMLYLPATSEAQESFRSQLRKLYGAVINYLCKARQYFATGSFERFLSDTTCREEFKNARVAIDEEDLKLKYHRELIDAERMKTNVVFSESTNSTVSSLAVKLADLQSVQVSLKQKLEDLESPFTRIDRQVDRLHTALEASERSLLLKWLSEIHVVRHHESVLSGVLPQSGEWLLNNYEFKTWKESSSSSFFWLHGWQGCGKSHLIAIAVENLKRQGIPLARPPPLAYFYCSRDTAEPQRSNCEEILRAILKQLSVSRDDGEIKDVIAKRYKSKLKDSRDAGVELSPLTASECVAVIIELTATSPTTIVIDALDECDLQQRDSLMLALEDIVSKSQGVVKILLGSRKDDDITLRLRQEPGINVTSKQNGEDLGRFIRVKVEEFIENWGRKTERNPHEMKALEDDIVTALDNGAHGMFLWVTLQLEAIQNTDRIKLDQDVRSALSHLPQSLTASYDAIHSRIIALEETSRKVAVAAFQWLLCTQRTLTSREFVAAVSRSVRGTVRISPSDICSCCCNLVVLDTESDTFRFAHLSVREYLESCPEYGADRVHSVVTTRCLGVYLWGNCSTDPLIDYATNYWTAHYEFARSSSQESELEPLLLQFFTEEEHFEDWQDLLRTNLQEPMTCWSLDFYQRLNSVLSSPPSPLFAACSFGFLEVLKHLVFHGLQPSWESVNVHGACGLYLAARAGHIDVVQYLLNHNCNIDAQGGRYGTALNAAAYSGHTEIVRLLMGQGATTACRDGQYDDPMQAALAGGHKSVAQILIECGFTFSSQLNFDDALQLASFNGHIDIVEQLLDGKAGDYSPAERHVPLQVALHGRKEILSERLLQACQDINKEHGYFGNALQAAIAGGKLCLVQLVLEKGGNPNLRGRFGYPLRAAAIRGQDEIVKLLLDHGASLDAGDEKLGDALQAAASKGHVSTMSILIDHGANIEDSGGPFDNPLEAALRGGHTQAAMLLRENMKPPQVGRIFLDASYGMNSGYWK
ncbi:hypothetical protein IWZ00DRAFT_6963 [Phyllosticta capitalensis]